MVSSLFFNLCILYLWSLPGSSIYVYFIYANFHVYPSMYTLSLVTSLLIHLCILYLWTFLYLPIYVYFIYGHFLVLSMSTLSTYVYFIFPFCVYFIYEKIVDYPSIYTLSMYKSIHTLSWDSSLFDFFSEAPCIPTIECLV